MGLHSGSLTTQRRSLEAQASVAECLLSLDRGRLQSKVRTRRRWKGRVRTRILMDPGGIRGHRGSSLLVRAREPCRRRLWRRRRRRRPWRKRCRRRPWRKPCRRRPWRKPCRRRPWRKPCRRRPWRKPCRRRPWRKPCRRRPWRKRWEYHRAVHHRAEAPRRPFCHLRQSGKNRRRRR